LEILDLTKCQLENLPFEFKNLFSLRKLRLYNNKFRKFPIVLCKMPFLKEIYINGNQLEEIPCLITKISELIVLDIAGNSIIDIQPHICDLQKLISFKGEYNGCILDVGFYFGEKGYDLEFLIKKRLVYRLFFILKKSFNKNFYNYKILRNLINY
jgi:Leucine-rich repeat (LRR) protein